MTLDLFLASMMRENPDLRARLRNVGVDQNLLAEVKERARGAGLLRGRAVPIGDYIALFGPPLIQTAHTLTYALQLWPEHLYEAGVNGFGEVFDRGFVLKEADTVLPSSVPLDLRLLHKAFQPGFHTMKEVAKVMGIPDEVQGWGAMEDWLYGPVKKRKFVSFEFDFGLLSSLQVRSYISLNP